MKHFCHLFLLIFLFFGCSTEKKNQIENQIVQTVKSPEEIRMEEHVTADSILQAENELVQNTAYGNLTFGMAKNEAEKVNEKRQLLGKYNYNFQNLYNGNKELYAVNLKSDGEKAIHFDDALKSNYNNLYKIIKTKYGEPELKREFPSIFDVQETSNYKVSQWDLGNKQIQLGIKENALNSYSIVAKIFDKEMEDAEIKRVSDIKNKDVIEASEKF